MEEGEGMSEVEFMDIDTAADSINGSDIFHIVTDILGFILFVHKQIPSVLQDMTQEFDELQTEYKELVIELAQTEGKALSMRRKQVARKREVKMGLRRLDKLMKCISNLKTALQLMITQVPYVEKICLVLGPSPLRPLHVYELFFGNVRSVSGDFSRSKVADTLSRKAIRLLISRGAGTGSNSYAGPTKLFLLVKAPCSLNLSSQFLVKSEIQKNKKVVPFRLRFRCRNSNPERSNQPNDSKNSTVMDLICFQCRHTIKGLPSVASPPED